MKSIALTFITLYQVFFSIILKQLLGIQASCRYQLTCSDYTKQMIARFGIIKGGYLGLRRIVSCNPLQTYGNL